jgi:hypothetical protein
MAGWKQNPIFIGAHVWFAVLGDAFTSPAPGTVSQNGAWPDVSEPKWSTDWAIGTVESFDIDPKYGPKEEILEPSPGQVQATDVIIPFAIPELKLITTKSDVLAVQLALNSTRLINGTAASFATNGSNGAGVRGIFKMQSYDHQNNLILNVTTWAVAYLSGQFKGAPKNMTKPEYLFTFLYSANNANNSAV